MNGHFRITTLGLAALTLNSLLLRNHVARTKNPERRSSCAGLDHMLRQNLKQCGRDALALALTRLVNDRDITRDRALELARMVLRGNALRLYQLEGATSHTVPPAQ